MNKTERLHDMMRFLNDKNSFHLKDLMNKYQISKSTALRDIQSLENIGMPIYSTPGRNGCYNLMRNRLLSPIVFTTDEVMALYFSMLTLRAYETTPFHMRVEQLKQKFESCLSAERADMLRRVEGVFSLATIQHPNQCPFLSDVLQYAIEEKVCDVTYLKNKVETKQPVQFYTISSKYGQWYAEGYNFETSSPRVFRCDKITGLEENHHYSSRPLSQLKEFAESGYKTQGAVDFEVEVSVKGVDLFHKEHYPSMKLHVENERYFIRGYYNKGEEAFIADYWIDFGEQLLSIQPASLKCLLVERLESLKGYFQNV